MIVGCSEYHSCDIYVINWWNRENHKYSNFSSSYTVFRFFEGPSHFTFDGN